MRPGWQTGKLLPLYLFCFPVPDMSLSKKNQDSMSENMFICSFGCGSEHKERWLWERHERECKHNPDRVQYYCTACHFVFYSMPSFSMHRYKAKKEENDSECLKEKKPGSKYQKVSAFTRQCGPDHMSLIIRNVGSREIRYEANGGGPGR